MKLRKFTLITTNILTITTLGAVSCTSEQKPKDPEPTPQPDPNVTAANSFKTTHSEVLNKTISNITLPDEAKVTAALNAYNSLQQAVKNNLISQKTLLDNLNAKILELKQAQNKLAPAPAPDQTETAANNFKNTHATVLAKTVDTLTLEEETNVNNALNAFNNLEQNVKDKLTSEKTLLDQLVAKIADLKEQAQNNQGTGEAEQPQRNTGPNFGGTDQFGGDPANPVTLNLFEFSEADDLGARFDKLLKEYLAKDAQKNDQRLKQMQIYGPTNETNQQVYLSIQGSGGKPETALLKLKKTFEVAKLEGTAVNNNKKRFIAEFNTKTRVLKITYKYDNKEYYDSLTIPAAKTAAPSQDMQNNQETQVPKGTTPSTEQPKEEENKITETQNPDANNTQNNGGTSGENNGENTQVTQNKENTQSDANAESGSSTQADAPDQSGTAGNLDNSKSNSTEQVAQETKEDASANNQGENKSNRTTKEAEQKLVDTQLKFESLTVIKDTNKRYIIFNVTSSKDLYEKIKDKDFKYILNKGNLEADDTTNGSNLKTRKLSESNGKVTFQIFPGYPWEDGTYTLTNLFDIKESNYNLLNKNYKFTLTSDNVVMDSN
ncbi:hypothetical protein [Mycoplasmopsis bovirhinis]|uniref:hypothetical protein n=1 Tax=Mycoplasmopsis bovirhinis TaxID=29553 RepID=UPI000E74D3E6|nr:hypothetical protein [Mycoplasmopsis bovirhinis]